jgi:hypothetical protein
VSLIQPTPLCLYPLWCPLLTHVWEVHVAFVLKWFQDVKADFVGIKDESVLERLFGIWDCLRHNQKACFDV